MIELCYYVFRRLTTKYVCIFRCFDIPILVIETEKRERKKKPLIAVVHLGSGRAYLIKAARFGIGDADIREGGAADPVR